MSSIATPTLDAFVDETRFGKWFLNTNTWKVHVVRRALTDLKRLLPAGQRCDRVLDVGCGFGHSFDELARALAPASICGLDADPDLQARAGARAKACPVPVTLHACNAS